MMGIAKVRLFVTPPSPRCVLTFHLPNRTPVVIELNFIVLDGIFNDNMFYPFGLIAGVQI